MKKHLLCMHLFLSLVCYLATACCSIAAAESPRPNIVFFLIDDLGRNDVGFMGGTAIRTPHIDKLAKEGSILDAHYVQPVCSPTRSALMTGRYPTRTGVYTVVRPHAKWGLPLEERTLASELQKVGYDTAITGKWHLGEFEPEYLPTRRGFTHQYGHYFGALDYFTHLRDKDHDWYRDDQPLHTEGYATELIADEACRLIESKPKDKPLFLYVPFNGVHAPLQAPERYLAMYPDLKGNAQKLAAMLTAVDDAIGKVVAQLEATGQRQNTLILFSSDNGGPNPRALSNNGIYRAGKGTLYEGGIRVCAFANWPGRITAGKTIVEPMHMVDWFPTLLKLAGAPLPTDVPLDGRDVWPMLTESAPSPHESIIVAKQPDQVALRAGDWKLIMNGGVQPQGARRRQAGTRPAQNNRGPEEKSPQQAAGNRFELYHLAKDPAESMDLAASEPERLEAMKMMLFAAIKDARPAREPAAASQQGAEE